MNIAGNYTIHLEQYDDGTFFGEILELPGCMTEADTREEVLEMLDDAKKAWLESAMNGGSRSLSEAI